MIYSARKFNIAALTPRLRALGPEHWVLAAIIAIGLWFAHDNAFMQDDAYISYNYAKWFSRGYGLVWYPGSTEFGYTNFLYTLMIGVGMILHIPPELASNTINSLAFIASLILSYTIGSHVLRHRYYALLPTVLLATHHSFTAYATGGLETMWVTALILGFYTTLFVVSEHTPARHRWIGLLAALAMLSRLDSVLLLVPGYIWLLATGMSSLTWQGAYQRVLQIYEAWLIPLVAVLGLLLCCLVAYGYALPNTFYVKVPGDASMIKYGLRYLALYNMLHLYVPLLAPLVLLLFYANRAALRRMGAKTALIASVLFLWLGYIIYVGGDFMEFRLLVPILFFYYLAVILLARELLKRRLAIFSGLIVLYWVGNLLHPQLLVTKPNILDVNEVPRPFSYAYVESSDTLNDWIRVPFANWAIIGKSLRSLFGSSEYDSLRLASANAGAIAYFSDLNVLDMLALNSRMVLPQFNAEADYTREKRPGHRVRAGKKTLEIQGVNISIGFPRVLCERNRRFELQPNPVVEFPGGRHETLFIPLGNSCYVVADYIAKHPAIEALLSDGVVIRYRDVAGRTQCPDWLCLR